MRTKIALLLSVIFLTVVSCKKNNQEVLPPEDDSPVFMDISSYYKPANLKSSSTGGVVKNNIAVLKAEYLTATESGEIGRTVYFFNVGNKQLNADFVPNPALSLDGTTDVSFYIDENRPSADQNVAISSAAIQRAMATWDGITCSDLGMFQVPSNGTQTGFVSELFGYGGSFDYISDVTFCGWMPANFFDMLAPGGSSFILGVTFTLIFTDESGDPVDSDNNNKSDVAWREIYFNDNFPWNDGATFDIETIALHEAGHGLSQAHFGKAFRDAGAGHLHFSPRAVMNAAYSGIQTEITKTDNAGHCSNWANWPK